MTRLYFPQRKRKSFFKAHINQEWILMQKKLFCLLCANGIQYIHKFTFEPCSPILYIIILYAKIISAQCINHVLCCLEITDAGVNFNRQRSPQGMHSACCEQKITFLNFCMKLRGSFSAIHKCRAAVRDTSHLYVLIVSYIMGVLTYYVNFKI